VRGLRFSQVVVRLLQDRDVERLVRDDPFEPRVLDLQFPNLLGRRFASSDFMPPASMASASRSLLMIRSGECRVRFIESLRSPAGAHRDSHRNWLRFWGAGQNRSRGSPVPGQLLLVQEVTVVTGDNRLLRPQPESATGELSTSARSPSPVTGLIQLQPTTCLRVVRCRTPETAPVERFQRWRN